MAQSQKSINIFLEYMTSKIYSFAKENLVSSYRIKRKLQKLTSKELQMNDLKIKVGGKPAPLHVP